MPDILLTWTCDTRTVNWTERECKVIQTVGERKYKTKCMWQRQKNIYFDYQNPYSVISLNKTSFLRRESKSTIEYTPDSLHFILCSQKLRGSLEVCVLQNRRAVKIVTPTFFSNITQDSIYVFLRFLCDINKRKILLRLPWQSFFTQDEKSGKKKKKQKLAKELSRCVNYVSSVGFKGFEHAKQNCKCHCFILSVENFIQTIAPHHSQSQSW